MSRRFRQAVPRPVDARPGRPPPWAELGVERRTGIGLAQVRAAIGGGSGPGLGQEVALASDPDPTGGPSVRAAVLLALFEESGDARAVLIRRAAELTDDPGHIALPGGHVEPGEPPLAAALRESEEEIGLDPGLVEVLGPLPVASRRRIEDRVLPFVGALERRPTLSRSPAEVEAVLDVSLAELLADGVAWQERWGPAGGHDVCFFAVPRLGEDLVWGLTGRILWSLLERVVGGGGRSAPAGPTGGPGGAGG